MSEAQNPPPYSEPHAAVFSRRGLWFEEFELGLRIRSGGRTVTEADLVAFAGLSGDHTRLHTDAEYCRGTPFRRPIAHGLLVQSLASGLAVRTGVFEGTLQALSDMTIHWRAPVFPGDTVRIELEVSRIDSNPSRRSGLVVLDARVFNQDEKLVCDGEWHTRMLRRDGKRDARAAKPHEETP
jgi:acyl dehydratase